MEYISEKIEDSAYKVRNNIQKKIHTFITTRAKIYEKKLKHEIGRLFKTKFLTDYPAQLYDVIAVNKKTELLLKSAKFPHLNKQ